MSFLLDVCCAGSSGGCQYDLDRHHLLRAVREEHDAEVLHRDKYQPRGGQVAGRVLQASQEGEYSKECIFMYLVTVAIGRFELRLLVLLLFWWDCDF